MNFVCCDAEFLPFNSSSFQTVHMRSVIDHFLNPELALNEAYRVLKNDGSLIVGLYVYGGKIGKVSVIRQIKDSVKAILTFLGINNFGDYHVWHPTYQELTKLLLDCGFKSAKVHWQEGYSDTVCYIKAMKQNVLTTRR